MGKVLAEISFTAWQREKGNTTSVMALNILESGYATSSMEKGWKSSQTEGSTMAAGSRAKNAAMVSSTFRMKLITKASS